ncbi:MAG: WecB/TagA/CpsF family glycosyltransferase [Beijerinckiaceae bacterium]
MTDHSREGQGAAVRTRLIFGVSVSDMSDSEAARLLADTMSTGRHVKLAFLNAHGANLAWSDDAFRQLLAGFTVLPDGVGVDIAAKMLTGAPFSANLNGTDFIPKLLQDADRPLRIALYGARPGVAARAAAVLATPMPSHSFGPVADGYGDAATAARFLATLEAAPVDILLVALGNPLQECWIAAHIDGRHARVAAGVGALFDFLAGEVERAPESWRRLRLEWLYRLAMEPRRMFRRYVLGNPLFLLRVVLAKLGLRRF